jgi:orotate phosphoribosyltransferase
LKESVALALLQTEALCFQPEAPLTFKSGLVSPVYVDNRRLQAFPVAWRTVIEAMAQELHSIESDNSRPAFEVIVGVATAGIPHSAALAFHMQRPSAFVRKAAKMHGTTQRIDGSEVDGKTVVLIEDMVTTGSSSLDAVGVLRHAGATVNHCVSITSYGFATDAFQRAGVALHPLVTFEVLLNIALQEQYLTEKQHKLIMDWFKDPQSWVERHGLA